ncbi:Replication protein A 70 kDa DNA-binding subunit B [Bienertia sinuspersici]
MRGIIFGSDIPLFEQAVVRDGEYEIGDAIISPVAEQYRQKENEFQMNFTRRMELIPVSDVNGIVLYVGNVRSVNISGREVPVRDIMVIDDSTQYPLCLSVWNDLAETDCELYTTWNTSYKIAGFTAMRVKTFSGFTLSSTMSTEIVFEPPHERRLGYKNG